MHSDFYKVNFKVYINCYTDYKVNRLNLVLVNFINKIVHKHY